MSVTGVASNLFVKTEWETKDISGKKSDNITVPVGGDTPKVANIDTLEKSSSILEDETIIEWREQTKKRPAAEETLKKMDADTSISKEEKYEKLKETEKQYIEEDTVFLKDKFAKNPELRVKMQENFDKLSAREQKALLNEAYTRENKDGEVKKLSKEEVDRFMKGLSSEKTTDEVKTLVIAALRNDKRVPQEYVNKMEEKLNIKEEQIANRLPSMKRAEAAAVVDNIMSDEKATPKAHKIVAEKLHQCNKDVHAYGVKCFTNSKHIGGKENAEARETFIKTLPKFEADVQNSAVKYIKQFESFNTQKDMQALKSVMPELKLTDEVRKMAEDYISSIKETNSSKNPFEDTNTGRVQTEAQNKTLGAASIVKSVAQNPKPATILAFTAMMAAGIIKPEMVISAGYTNVLSSYFSNFSRDVQESIFDKLSLEERVAMYEAGKLPKTFEGKLMNEIKGSRSMNVSMARNIAYVAGKEDLKELQNKYSATVNNIFTEKLERNAAWA